MKRSLPDILYHYTSARAFLDIVKSKAIWASNVRFLNDTAELRHAISKKEFLLVLEPMILCFFGPAAMEQKK